MPNAATQIWVREHTELTEKVGAIKQSIADANNGGGRDIEPGESEQLKVYATRLGQLQRMIGETIDDFDLDDAVKDKLSRIAPGMVDTPTPKYRTAGEMLWDCLHATYGSTHDHDDQEAVRRYAAFQRSHVRAAEHMGTSAAATTPTAGGFGGLTYSAPTGPVIDMMPSGRPFLSALGVRPAPNSLSFARPRIVDPSFKSGGVGPQALEKAELVSKAFSVVVDPLTLSTVGGYLNLSAQAMAFIPAALDMVVAQLLKRLAYSTEIAAMTELAKTTAKVTLAAGADAATVLKAVFDAAALVFTNTGDLPRWIVMGPSGWARLGSLVDLAGRPLFPYIGAANAIGTAQADQFPMVGPAGLQAIVTYAISDTKMYVGGSDALEAYEYRYPVLEAVEPSLLGRQIAVASSLAFYRPTTKEAGPANTPPAEGNGAVLIGP